MRRLTSLAAAFILAAPAVADEGMWTFDAFPSARVAEKHGFGPDQAWLDRVRASAVRLSSGCSASAVSAQGLVLTNWHCVTSCIQNLSTPEQDHAANGFLARTAEEEKTCPGVQGEILTGIEDVTDRVQAVLKDKAPEAVAAARTAEIAAIEAEACKDDATAKCDVVSLYQGGQYKLYRFRVYKDVRLVFAPETAAGFFGGDPDNFNFPRFNYDAAFLRLYEDGKPAALADHLPWRTEALAAGDLTFVAGNPGSTSRLFTIAQMHFERDWRLPVRQLVRSELRGRLIAYSAADAEAARTAADTLFGVENSFKATYGEQRALMDPAFMGQLEANEARLKDRVAADPALAAEIGDPWAEMEKVVAAQTELFLAHDFLEARAGSISELYGFARTLVRAANERPKPNGERLPAFSDQRLPQIERALREATPVYPGLEEIGLGFWLSKTREYLTADDPRVQKLLGTDSPEAIAERAIDGTTLGDPAVRMALWEGGKAAVDASTDPLIVLARTAEQDAYSLALAWRERVEGPRTLAAEKLARARFALDGESVYPDATFSLRLSYGTVKGWTYLGREVAPFTTFEGLYARATGAPPFALPQRWIDAKAKLNPATAFNVVTDNDIIGGNSGSPLIDREGRVAGAVFDGNIHSLGGDYGFDAGLNRSVSVTSVAILEGLRTVYGMDRIADEIEGK
jgi:hypothetical protein